MRILTQRPNLYCKLSGLEECTCPSDGSALSDIGFYRPVLDALREKFGSERLIYAGN